MRPGQETGPQTRKRGPGDRKAAMERREAPAFSKGNAARRKTGAPLGAPSPRLYEGRRKGRRRPRAVKNRGDSACPLPSAKGKKRRLFDNRIGNGRRAVPRRERLVSVPVPPRRIGIGGTIVPPIVINVSVPGIETVIAREGAAVAPIPVTVRDPEMPHMPQAGQDAEIGGIRGRRRANNDHANNSSANRGGKYQPFDGTSGNKGHVRHPICCNTQCRDCMSPQNQIRRQIKTAGLVKVGRTVSLISRRFARQPGFPVNPWARRRHSSGCVSGNMSTTLPVIAFTIST